MLFNRRSTSNLRSFLTPTLPKAPSMRSRSKLRFNTNRNCRLNNKPTKSKRKLLRLRRFSKKRRRLNRKRKRLNRKRRRE